MHFNEIVMELDSYLSYLYSGLFLVSLAVFKKHTSLSITIVLLALAEFVMQGITMPLLQIVSDKSTPYIIRLGVWLMTWICIDLFVVYMLQKAHEWLNLSKGIELQIIQGAFIAFMVLHLIHFIDRMLIRSDVLGLCYQFGIPLLNFSIAGYLVFHVFKHLEFSWKPQSSLR